MGGSTRGFFPLSHRYTDRTKNYIVKVTAYYQDGTTDSVETPVRFVTTPPLPLTPFDLKRHLFGRPRSLFLGAPTANKGSGIVRIEGGDGRGPTTPFTFDWGDGQSTDGFFVQQHRYTDTTRNYRVVVTAHYPGGATDYAETMVMFVAPRITPKPLPPELSVTIPNQPLRLAPSLPGFDVPTNLGFFDDSHFPVLPRAAVEYVLTAGATVQLDLVNDSLRRINGQFRQVILKADDPNAPAGFSIWSSYPVGIGISGQWEHALRKDVAWLVFLHEMGHNFTLNTPPRLILGGNTDGPGSTVLTESLATIFSIVTALEMSNNHSSYGIPEEIASRMKQQCIQDVAHIRTVHEQCLQKRPFKFWHRGEIDGEATGWTVSTIIYKFLSHAENQGQGYRTPVKRMLRVIQTFDESLKQRYDQFHDTPEASTFRSTFVVAALSYAYSQDLRAEFRALNFPDSDTVYEELLARVR
jgi:hypothetical protein